MSKKEQEHKDLSWFTLPQGLRPVPYSTVRISTLKDQSDQFTTIQTLATGKNTLLPVANSLLNLQQIMELYKLHCIFQKTPY